RQSPRSAAVAFASRGSVSSGTEIRRPSRRDTVRKPSATSADTAAASCTKELMPHLQQVRAIGEDEPPDRSDTVRRAAPIARQFYRLEPELRRLALGFDVDLSGLCPFVAVEEEAEARGAHHGRHVRTLRRPLRGGRTRSYACAERGARYARGHVDDQLG